MSPINDTFAARPVTQAQQTNLPNNIGMRFFDPPHQIPDKSIQGITFCPANVHPWETFALEAKYYADAEYRIAYGAPQQATYTTAMGLHAIPPNHNVPSMPYLTGQSFQAHPPEQPYRYQHMDSMIARERRKWIYKIMRDEWQRKQEEEKQQRQQQQRGSRAIPQRGSRAIPQKHKTPSMPYLTGQSSQANPPERPYRYEHMYSMIAQERGAWIHEIMRDAWQRKQEQQQQIPRPPRRALPENWAHLQDWVDQQRPGFQVVLDACERIERNRDISWIIFWEEVAAEMENPWLDSSDAGVLDSRMGDLSLI